MKNTLLGKIIILIVVTFLLSQLSAFLINEWTEIIDLRGIWLYLITVADLIISIVVGIIWHRFENHQALLPAELESTLDTTCGDSPLDLSRERLFLSSALGTYFASLLEAPATYQPIEGQIMCHIPKGLANLNPFQRILYELVSRNGAQIIVIAADGGMGKSTLAARLVRCLYGSREYDRILGDSAKDEVVEIHAGTTKEIKPGFIDQTSFLQKLADQLGVGEDEKDRFGASGFIRDYLAGQNVLIVVDNLESVEAGDELLQVIRKLTGKSTRAIITTREADKFERDQKTFVVYLKPMRKPRAVTKFVKWHIDTFAQMNPDLLRLSTPSRSEIKLLIEKSGGVPLVMQLLMSDVARSKGWHYLEGLRDPGLPQETLDFFFLERWDELQAGGDIGALAIEILSFVGSRQLSGERTTFNDLSIAFVGRDLKAALDLLHNRFMILNRDLKKGDFTLFPHLIQFMNQREFIKSEAETDGHQAAD